MLNFLHCSASTPCFPELNGRSTDLPRGDVCMEYNLIMEVRGTMKRIRMLLGICFFAWVTMGMTGCTWNFHDPTPTDKDVQIVGDSVFDLSGEIQTRLKALSGKMYQDRSVSNSKIAAIQSQLAAALTRKTVKTVIANGGANDIFQSSADCYADPLTKGCKEVLNYVGDKTEVMINNMHSKSPKNGVWLGYYHVKGEEAEYNEAVDYLYKNVYKGIFPKKHEVGITCWPAVYIGKNFKVLLVDPRSSIKSSDIKKDNIHPTTSGSKKLADLIWSAMYWGKMYR
jgi:hypothetical protein